MWCYPNLIFPPLILHSNYSSCMNKHQLLICNFFCYHYWDIRNLGVIFANQMAWYWSNKLAFRYLNRSYLVVLLCPVSNANVYISCLTRFLLKLMHHHNAAAEAAKSRVRKKYFKMYLFNNLSFIHQTTLTLYAPFSSDVTTATPTPSETEIKQ